MDHLIVLRVFVCLLNRVIELSYKPSTKAIELGFVPVAGVERLGFSATPNDEFTRHLSASNLAFTSLQEDPSSGSLRYSS